MGWVIHQAPCTVPVPTTTYIVFGYMRKEKESVVSSEHRDTSHTSYSTTTHPHRIAKDTDSNFRADEQKGGGGEERRGTRSFFRR